MTDDKQPASEQMADVQGYRDTRQLPITRVGIKRIKSPVIVADKSAQQHTVADCSLSVFLPEDRKGTHMSRFTQLLNDYRQQVYSISSIGEIYRDMLERLDSNAGTLEISFPYFIEKHAPVTQQTGMLDYQVSLIANAASDGSTTTSVTLDVPVTTLCPCSKEISKYGAHSQRSVITIDAIIGDNRQTYWEDLIVSAEEQASAQLYSQLKRADEKFVTERAYENPRFVEDLIREVAAELNKNNNLTAYRLEVENFESIHNHSAWARIDRTS
jgi:GTP cyclohydrolase I